MRHLIVAVVVAALPAVAHAETMKDPETAWQASLGATAVPVALGALAVWKGPEEAAWVLIGAGVVIGPSAGHWYAGKPFSTGLEIRLAGTALAGALLLPAFDCAVEDEGRETSCGVKQAGFLLGIGAMVVGAVHDLATASGAARRANARTFQIAPTMISGTRGAGVGVSGSF